MIREHIYNHKTHTWHFKIWKKHTNRIINNFNLAITGNHGRNLFSLFKLLQNLLFTSKLNYTYFASNLGEAMQQKE